MAEEVLAKVVMELCDGEKEREKCLVPGLYALWWNSGGYSLASVGVTADGRNWYAPINWIDGPSSDWSLVRTATKLDTGGFESELLATATKLDTDGLESELGGRKESKVVKETFSRYMPEIVEFATKVGGKAAYCFVLDGSKGTGGCPVVMGTPPHAEYLQRCRELIGLLRRSADLLERDIAPKEVDVIERGDYDRPLTEGVVDAKG